MRLRLNKEKNQPEETEEIPMNFKRFHSQCKGLSKVLQKHLQVYYDSKFNYNNTSHKLE